MTRSDSFTNDPSACGSGRWRVGVKEREISSSISRTRNWGALTRLGAPTQGRDPPPRPRAAPLPGEGSPTGKAAELSPASRAAGSPPPPASTPASSKNHRHQCTSTATGCRLTVWACAERRLILSAPPPAGGLASEQAHLVSRGTRRRTAQHAPLLECLGVRTLTLTLSPA